MAFGAMALPVAVPAHAQPRQVAPCAVADRAEDAPPVGVPAAQAFLDLDAVHAFSTGAGQTVAVIDTGVTPHPRLPHLRGGGDLVGALPPGADPPADGLVDCDGHGTLVAGLIAAAPSEHDGFSGIAPGAGILAIRQSSGKFSDGAGDDGKQVGSGGIGTVGSLADAIRMAAAEGATVINISEVACGQGVGSMRSAALAGAVDYAAAHDIVIVVAAGNTGGGRCRQNPTRRDPLQPRSRGWDSAFTDVAPAHFTDHVITVASVDPDGTPSDFSVAGPWVTVAAPGTNMVSLANEPAGGLADRIRTEQGVSQIDGTSFAAPLVAGLAADIRARYPDLPAAGVIDRITATASPGAHAWEPSVGYGVIDPVAALSAPAAVVTGRGTGVTAPHPRSGVLAAAPADDPPAGPARARAVLAAAVTAALAAAAALCRSVHRRRRA